jgi:multiple sugar transport system substrate-binding protein
MFKSRSFVTLLLLSTLFSVIRLRAVQAQEVVTLTYGWWSNGPEGDAAHRAWLYEFEKANPNIKIESEILPWGAYWDKLQTTTAAGNSYDILGFTSGLVAPY